MNIKQYTEIIIYLIAVKSSYWNWTRTYQRIHFPLSMYIILITIDVIIVSVDCRMLFSAFDLYHATTCIRF